MILDHLANAADISSLHPLFPKAFEWLCTFDPNSADGKHSIVRDQLTANVQRYHTAASDEKLWEAHRMHGDIQAVFEGEEICGYAPTTELESLVPYHPEKDVEKFVAPKGPHSHVLLKPGLFCVLYPKDAHQPGVKVTTVAPVLKVVIKFKL
jgi:YhcH/YjgK/YiaL family protein